MQPADRIAQLQAQSIETGTVFDGARLSWRRWGGDNPGQLPLVLVHGGFGSWTHWAANLPELMSQRQVWTVDLPGLGDSELIPAPHTTQRFAAALLTGLRECIGEDAPFELAAFSFGAMISGHVAAMAGAQCRRLTAIGASGFGPLHVQVALVPPPQDGAPEEEVRQVTRENLRRLMLTREERLDELALHIHAENLARHRFRSRKLAGSNDLAQILPDIEAHLLGIWGDHDATAGDSAALAARRDLFLQAQPDARFVVLDGVGHWAMYDDPDSINRLLLEHEPTLISR